MTPRHPLVKPSPSEAESRAGASVTSDNRRAQARREPARLRNRRYRPIFGHHSSADPLQISTDACQAGADLLADVVWPYERPVPEANKLAGLVSFDAEHAAVETHLDGDLQPKPVIDSAAISPRSNLANEGGSVG